MRTTVKLHISILTTCGKTLIEHRDIREIVKGSGSYLHVSFKCDVVEHGKSKERSLSYNGFPFIIETERINFHD